VLTEKAEVDRPRLGFFMVSRTAEHLLIWLLIQGKIVFVPLGQDHDDFAVS